MKTFQRYIALLAVAAALPAMAIDEAEGFVPAIENTENVEVALDQVVPFYSYTGAISTVTDSELQYWQDTSLDEALLGKLAGYYGGDVRGLSSINGTAVLVVLDGVPSPTIALDQLDPRSIASVSVLKDAAAKALYGPLAAQGAILVTTKRGHDGKSTVRASVNIGWQQPTTRAEVADAYEYATLRNQALVNDGLLPKFSANDLAAYQNGTYSNNNWRSKYMKDFRPQQIYNIEIAGGNSRTKYYVNAGYARTGSLFKGDFTEKYNPEEISDRFNLVSNIQVDVFSFLKMRTGTNVRLNMNNRNGSANDIIEMLYTTPATVEDGLTPDGHLIVDEVTGESVYGEINYKGVNKITNTDINAYLALDLDLSMITEGLGASATVGYNSYYNGKRVGTYNYSRWVRSNDPADPFTRTGTATDDPLAWGKNSTMNYFMSFQAMIKYQRTFAEKHALDAFITYLAEDRLKHTTNTGWLLPYNRIQLGGHVQYGFDKRYIAQFDFTYAGNEQMAEGNQFHFSPTGSLAWVVSNESFLEDQNWLNLLKVRASFGMLQYDVLATLPSRYLYSTDYRMGSGGVQEIYTFAGVSQGVIGNPDLQFEKSYQQDYGFDIAVLDNSLTMSFDYWRTRQTDMIYQRKDVPAISGISTSNLPYVNAGIAESQGVDISLGYNAKVAGELGISINGDFGWNTNKVIEGGDIDYTALGYAYPFRTSGYAIDQKFGYLVDYANGNGFFNSQAEIDNSNLKYSGVAPRVGDLRFRDLNGDGIIDEGDLAPLDGVTTSRMPHYDFGASIKLDWRGFDLYVYLQGQTGRNAYYSGLGIWENNSQGVYTPMHYNAWTPERYAAGEAISYPALSTTTSASLCANDFFTSRADYLRLKNVTLGYSLPKQWMKAIGFSNIRFYVTGQNLLSATNFKYKNIIDPEKKNIANFIYRTYCFGVNIEL